MQSFRLKFLAVVFFAVGMAAITAGLFGVSVGSSTTVGRTQKGGSSTGCSGCHALNTAISVQITGPASLRRGQTATYTLTTSKSGASGCVPAGTECRNVGIDVASDDNTLTLEPGEPTEIINNEITHSCGNPCNKALLRRITTTGPAVYKLNYTMPAGAGVGTSHFLYAVVAVGPSTGGGSNHAPNFQVLTAPPPVISGFAPTSGPIGTRVIVTGTALSDVTVVRFNGISAAFTVDSGTQITAFVPSGATTGTITASAGGDTATSPAPFTITSGAGGRKFGRFGFVLNSAEDQVSPAGDTVSFYILDEGSGLLRHNGYEPTGSSSSAALAVDPFERFVFVANRADDSISVLKIEPPGASPFAGRAFGIGSLSPTRPLPGSLTVDPGGRFLYVAHRTGLGEVTSFKIDSASGALTQVGAPVAAGDTPQGITVHPSGKFVYVANYLSNNVSAYSVDSETGSLTTAGTFASPGSFNPFGLTVHPSGGVLYVANESNHLSAFSINPTTGALAFVSNSASLPGSTPHSVVVDPGGKFAFVANSNEFAGANRNTVSSYSIDPASGSLTLVGTVAAGSIPESVLIDPGGRYLYAANRGSHDVSMFSVNPSTGALTGIRRIAARNGASSIALSSAPAPVGYAPRFAYVTNRTDNNVSAYTIGGLDGVLTPVAGSPFVAGTSPTSVAVDPTARFAFATNNGSQSVSAYTVNTTTGELTSAGSPLSGGVNPVWVAVDPVGKFIYVANNGNNVGDDTLSGFTIDQTGALVAMAGSPFLVGGTPRPSSIAVDPSGRFAYVTNEGTDIISAWAIHPTTGDLTHLDHDPATPATIEDLAGGGGEALTVDPSGSFVVVAHSLNNTITPFAIEPSTGLLTKGTALNTGSNSPASVMFEPAGRFAYVVNFNGETAQAYSMNPTTGALALFQSFQINPDEMFPTSISVEPSGRFAFVSASTTSDVRSYSINSTTGALGKLTEVATGTGPSFITTTGVLTESPTVSSVSPTSGPEGGGTSVTFTGSGFKAGATVTFGGTAATNVVVGSATSITATAPAHAPGAVDVVVRNTDGQSAITTGAFTYVAAPQITGILPGSGTISGGTNVTITGTGFVTGATVTFGGTAATNVVVASVTSITATAPAHAPGAVDVVVRNTNGQSATSTAAFTYIAAPGISSISPTGGSPNGGTIVTITGTGFVTGATVTFGGTAASNVTVASSTSITATTPVHAAGVVDVVVRNADGQSGTLASGFTFSAPPTISSVAPTSGPGADGITVTITGTGFATGATVTFGGTAATNVVVASVTSITATAPVHAPGAVDVVVRNSDGQSATAAGAFTYISRPGISSVTPSSGPTSGGTSVTITGSDFVTGATVTFGGTAATSVVVASATSITATTPAHAAGAVNVVVRNADGSTGTLVTGFTFSTVLAPTVSGVSPASGSTSGGSPVTISGANFSAGVTVTFGGTAATNVVLVNSTTITATTPARAAGAADVVVRNPDGQTGTLTAGFAFVVAATGDVNADGAVTVGDVFYLINFLFAGGPGPIGSGDANGDGAVTAGDVFYLINFLFAGGPAPV